MSGATSAALTGRTPMTLYAPIQTLTIFSGKPAHFGISAMSVTWECTTRRSPNIHVLVMPALSHDLQRFDLSLPALGLFSGGQALLVLTLRE